MAQVLLNIWTSTDCKEEQAQELANYFNSNLVPAHRITIVKLTDTWFVIAGSTQAKATCDRLTKEIRTAEARKKGNTFKEEVV